MSGDKLLVILPLLALVLAGVSIAGLWYWWTSTSDEEKADDDAASPAPPAEPAANKGLDEEFSGSFFERLRDSLSPVSDMVKRALPQSQPASFDSQPSWRASSVPPVSSMAGSHSVEVMRLLRDLSDGSLIVEIDGRRYHNLREISDPQMGRHFMGNAQALARFARLDEYSVPEDEAETYTPPAAPSPEPQWQPPAAPPPAAPPPASLIPRMATPSSEGDAEPAAELSMAEEIEELLQFRLTMTPDMAHHSIHIRPGVGGGIRIEVDGQHYDGVGDVPDADVREFIQATTREWEARQ